MMLLNLVDGEQGFRWSEIIAAEPDEVPSGRTLSAFDIAGRLVGLVGCEPHSNRADKTQLYRAGRQGGVDGPIGRDAGAVTGQRAAVVSVVTEPGRVRSGSDQASNQPTVAEILSTERHLMNRLCTPPCCTPSWASQRGLTTGN